MTQFRRRLLHYINLSRPHTGKVIFYCVCQSLINPCTPSILLRERKRWGGLEKQKHLTILFFSRSLSLFLISIPACHKLASFFSHRTLTPIAFSFFFWLHMEALLLPAGCPLLSNGDEWLWLLYRFPN